VTTEISTLKLCADMHEYNYRVVQVANFSVKRPIIIIYSAMCVSTQQFLLVPCIAI